MQEDAPPQNDDPGGGDQQPHYPDRDSQKAGHTRGADLRFVHEECGRQPAQRENTPENVADEHSRIVHERPFSRPVYEVRIAR